MSEDGGVGSLLEHTGGDGPPAIAADIFLFDMQYVIKYICVELGPRKQIRSKNLHRKHTKFLLL